MAGAVGHVDKGGTAAHMKYKVDCDTGKGIREKRLCGCFLAPPSSGSGRKTNRLRRLFQPATNFTITLIGTQKSTQAHTLAAVFNKRLLF